MSAALCGKRSSSSSSSSSSIFHDPCHPHPAKRSRSCALSPPPLPPLLSHLRSLFPHMNQQVLERALQSAGNDLDSAIKSLTDLCLEPQQIEDGDAHLPTTQGETILSNDGNICPPANPLRTGDASDSSGASEWVELFVQEMMNASDLDDARSRASRALEVFEKSISSRVSPESMQNVHKENSLLKEQMEVVLRENVILKRAVAIQHDRQKEQEERLQEAQHFRQMVSQYQEEVRTLEVNNYALMMHLKQAQQGNSIPGRFNPDVF